MQVLLKHSRDRKDIECSICKQGFRLFWESSHPAERATMRAIVQGELARHHGHDDRSRAAHPAQPFSLPGSNSHPEFSSAAAILGGLRRPNCSTGAVAAIPTPPSRPTPRHSR